MPTAPRNPDHDYDDPANQDTFLRAYEDMTNYDAHPRCRYCTDQRRPLAMHGTAWGWESIHAEGCPAHEDSQEPNVLRVTDNFGGPEHLAAEEIWAAGQPDGEDS
jgi:hypothetical protein